MGNSHPLPDPIDQFLDRIAEADVPIEFAVQSVSGFLGRQKRDGAPGWRNFELAV